MSTFINIVHNPYTGWVVLVLSLIVTLAAFLISQANIDARAQEKFNSQATGISDAIQKRLSLYEQALWGGVGLFRASQHVDREEWRAYTNALNLPSRLPGIQALGYAIPVAPGARKEFESQVRAEGFPDFSVTPGYARDEYTAIYLIEPFNWRNQRAFGYDMWSNPTRREAMQRARDSGEAARSGLITLVQETGKDIQKGFLSYIPVYKSAEEPGSLESRRAELQGWVYAAFRAGDLMYGVLGSNLSALSFSIYDGTEKKAESLLYNSSTLQDANSPKMPLSDDILTSSIQLDFQGQPWLIYHEAQRGDVVSSLAAQQPYYVLIAGIIIDILLFYVIVSLHYVNKHARESSLKLEYDYRASKQHLVQQSEKINETRKESQIFFDLAPEAFLIVSQNGVIAKANKHAHTLFGYETGEMDGLMLEQLVPYELQAKHKTLRQDYQANPTNRAMNSGRVLEAMRKDGSTILTNINLVNYSVEGEIHTVAAVHDVSTQKTIENNLTLAKQKAEQASLSKSEFVANMSHEIRTPLNAVLGSSQLLQKTEHSENQARYINMIRTSGEILLGIINDILDFSKIEAGKMELHPASFDLDNLISRVASMMAVNAGEKDIELVINIHDDVPRKLCGDALRLQQALVNLSSNAIKFTEQGCVKIEIFSLNKEKDQTQRLLFTVTDTGIGMTSMQCDQLFNAFTQADTSITRRFGGTGLGLVITNKIIELMNGEMHVVSVPNKGSTFNFQVDVELDKTTKEENTQEFLPADTKKHSLVIVENKSQKHAIFNLFTRWQWKCTAVQDVQFLDQLLYSDAFSPSVTLIDRCILSSMESGLRQALFEKARANNGKLILTCEKEFQLSAIDNKLQRNQYCDSELVKPVHAENLRASLKNAFKIQSSNSGDTPANAEENQLDLSHIRILLVEDNELNQIIATEILADTGVAIDLANNGQEAVQAFEKDSTYDLILMDIQMPVMDGLTATKILRDKLHCTVPIVAMTAGVLKSEQANYLKGGLDDFVAKPVDERELLQTLQRQLQAKVLEGIKSSKQTLNTSPAFTSENAAVGTSESNPVFNPERLERLINGRIERLQRISKSIKKLSDEWPTQMETTRRAIERGDSQTALQVFHGLRGVVANFGGDFASFKIQEIETRINKGTEGEDILTEFASLSEDLAAFVENADHWAENYSEQCSRR